MLLAWVICSLILGTFGSDPKDDVACGSSRPRVIVADNGRFTSPNFPNDYPNNADCQWRLTSEDPESRVRLEFGRFQTESRYDTVDVYDGESTSSTRLDSISGVQTGVSFESSAQSLYVVFDSDSSIVESGFLGKFTTDGACFSGGNRVLTGDSGTFTSPYYPEEYGTNMNCTWTLETQPGFAAVLEFDSFELEFEPNCEWDHVDIVDGSDLVGRFCGNNTPPVIVASSNSLSVTFRMDQSIVRGGFSATYQIVPSGSTPFPITTPGETTTGSATQPTPPPVDDDIIPPFLVVAINGSYRSDDNSDISVECGVEYTEALRAAAQRMVLNLYELGFCSNTDIFLATSDTTGYIDNNMGLFKFDFNLISGLLDSRQGLEACAREISDFTRVVNHWPQPLIPQFPGCPKAIFESEEFGDLGFYYDCV